MELLSLEAIEFIHDSVINPNELQGLAGDKSLEGIVDRVESLIAYGLIIDIYSLAATYAIAISQGHVFNDANKRTAFETMAICLEINEVSLTFETEEIGQLIIKAAQGIVDEIELASYLRSLAINPKN